MEREILFISKDTSILERAKQSAIECNLKINCTIPCGVHLSYAASNYTLAIVHLSADISDEIAAIRWIDSHKGTPIAAFSDNPSREEEIFLLYSGADQYWGLPADYELIKAHIHALHHRYERDRDFFKRNPDVLEFDCGLSINISVGIAFWAGKRINLRPIPLIILVTLASNVGETVSKELLVEKIWKNQYDVSADADLKHHISQLRKKLKELGASGLIETVWGIGYKLKNDTLLQ